MDVCFHIPDFVNHFRLNMLLINSIKDCPEFFRDGIKIASVFGCFGNTLWNGGRLVGGNTDLITGKKLIEIINIRNVPVRFTFTNPLITDEHLADMTCNQWLRIANNGFNEVIVVSPVLEEYIRKNYPDYPITSSTCKQIETIDGVLDELKQEYKYVVLDYNLNNKFDMLEKINPDDRSRCEILVNACCVPGCKRRGEHYRTIGQNLIDEWKHKKDYLSKKPFEPVPFQCDSMSRTIYDITEFSTYVSPDDIYEKYLPMGFNNFKIEGRTAPDVELLDAYLHYMAKPEHKDKLRLKMLLMLTGQKHF